MKDNLTIAVFCGSTMGNSQIYREKTIELGNAMLREGASLVYGGGNRGLMGVLAHTVADGGGHITGVLPKAMNRESVTHGSARGETIIVGSMHERKKTMYDMADGFIALPGGIGTFEEFCEIYTWRQLGYTKENIALFNANGYYEPFLDLLDKAVEEGFVMKAVRDILIVSDDPEYIIRHLKEDSEDLPDKL